MKQINFRKNEKITVGLILLLLCIFLAVTGSGPVTLDIYRNACGYPQFREYPSPILRDR